jgi:multiple antibiotic resistance protein
MNWDLFINFFAAMMAIVNPIGIWPMWSEMTRDESSKIRKRIALMMIGTTLIILITFLIAGKFLLEFFSIELAVFKISGGILLLVASLSMIKGQATSLRDRDEEGETDFLVAKKRFKKIFVPIGIPRLSGPGSITTVILFGTRAESFGEYFGLSVVVFVSFVILLLVFLQSKYLEKNVDNIVFTTFTRIFGIILAAIAVQFMVEGLGEVFPNWMEGTSVLETKSTKN